MQSVNNNKLKGKFVECCDCYTICPCWVNERPDEDHCSALYIWTFDDDAKIEGRDIGGKSVAAAAFYRSRSGVKSANLDANDKPEKLLGRPQLSIDPEQQNADGEEKEPSSNMQSAIYVDDRMDKDVQQLLIDAFSGRTIKSLQSLQRLVGTVVDSGPAKIVREESNGEWTVTVEVEGSRIAHATGEATEMGKLAKPLTLNDTALHDELGIEGAVELQKVNRFEMAVSPLPGGPFVYSGRSGMAANFDYSGRV
jgi:hypothetical protein